MNPKVVFTEEALEFIRRQPKKAQEKEILKAEKVREQYYIDKQQ